MSAYDEGHSACTSNKGNFVILSSSTPDCVFTLEFAILFIMSQFLWEYRACIFTLTMTRNFFRIATKPLKYHRI